MHICSHNSHRLGLAIPDGAIEEMKARVVVTDEDLKIAAAEGVYSALVRW
jgi:peroxiredoxin